MKIAIFCDYLHSFGGTEYYNVTLATELKKRGVDVRVYVSEKTVNPYWINILKNNKINCYEPHRHRKDRNDRSVDIEFIRDNIADLASWSPDIIHASPAANLLLAYLNEGKIKNIPIVATEHTTPSPESSFWYPDGFQKCLNNIDTFIATCKSSATGIKKFHKFKGNIKIIPHFIIKKDALKVKRISNSVGCIARMSPEKGIGILLVSWKEVVKKIPNAKLYLYGSGSVQNYYERLMMSLGLQNSVYFCGTFDPKDGPASIAMKHDIFVQPSLFESIPTSIIELSLLGRPIIATNVGGVKELINKNTGILIKSGSTDKMSKAIIDLLKDKEKQEGISRNAKTFIGNKYDLDTNITKIINLYKSIIKKQK